MRFRNTGIALALATVGFIALGQMVEAPGVQAQAVPTRPNTEPAEAPHQTSVDPLVERGRYIATAGDCVACHTAPGGKPFAGGYALETPFGKILASNVTQDLETGIGKWTEQQFNRAVREGVGTHGNLYPAMPYTAYAKVTDEDMHALWAYMKTVAPVQNAVVENQLPFPYNIRLAMWGWNLLFFDSGAFKPNPAQSAEWNRGAYLVEGLEHCGSCHTPKNFLGGDVGGAGMQGGALQGWYAPEITNNAYLGLGEWSVEQVVAYLKTGGNDISMASGPMAEAVLHSTQHLTDADLRAMAVYLKSLPGSGRAKPTPVAASDAAMAAGQALYADNCEACHIRTGEGVPAMISAMAKNPLIQAPDPQTLIHTVLVGNRGAATVGNPTGAGMPAFGWKLSDKQVADVLTYVRNSWGNAAPAVTAEAVQTMRQSLGAPQAPLSAAR